MWRGTIHLGAETTAQSRRKSFAGIWICVKKPRHCGPYGPSVERKQLWLLLSMMNIHREITQGPFPFLAAGMPNPITGRKPQSGQHTGVGQNWGSWPVTMWCIAKFIVKRDAMKTAAYTAVGFFILSNQRNKWLKNIILFVNKLLQERQVHMIVRLSLHAVFCIKTLQLWRLYY